MREPHYPYTNMYQVGDKLKLKPAHNRYRTCGTLEGSGHVFDYVVFDSLYYQNDPTSGGQFTAYRHDGTRVTSCGGCLRLDDFVLYEQQVSKSDIKKMIDDELNTREASRQSHSTYTVGGDPGITEDSLHEAVASIKKAQLPFSRKLTRLAGYRRFKQKQAARA